MPTWQLEYGEHIIFGAKVTVRFKGRRRKVEQGACEKSAAVQICFLVSLYTAISLILWSIRHAR